MDSVTVIPQGSWSQTHPHFSPGSTAGYSGSKSPERKDSAVTPGTEILQDKSRHADREWHIWRAVTDGCEWKSAMLEKKPLGATSLRRQMVRSNMDAGRQEAENVELVQPILKDH